MARTARKAAPRVNQDIDAISPSKLAALTAVHNVIRKAAPMAVESQTYGARGYRVEGMPVVGLGASARALSFYVMSSGFMAAFTEAFDELGLRYSKGTVQFSAEKPLPAALVSRIVKARLAENAKLRETRTAKAKSRTSGARAKK